MSGQTSRGGAAVGRLADLNPVEAGAVMYLRLWSEAAEGRSLAEGEMASGAEENARVFALLDQMFGLCARHGRRPLVRHGVTCACLGADENCFAQMVAAASEGARDDAMMMALLIVRPDLAPALVALSEQFGLVLRRMVGAAPFHGLGENPMPAVLH